MKTPLDSAAIVTGGAGAIGTAIAMRLAKNRCFIHLVDKDSLKLGKAVKLLEAEDLGVEGHLCDITKEKDVISLAAKINSNQYPLRILVNNAGVSPKLQGGKIPFKELDAEEWNAVIETNLTGAFLCCKHFLTQLISVGDGRIINITSVMAKLGSAGRPESPFGPFSPSGAHYSASKAALSNLTFSIAREFAPAGITCNAVAPGAVFAGLGQSLDQGSTTQQIPIGRLATTHDIAAAVAFLASEDASYITGEILDVNGGWVMD
ncbi:SDR family oxidoreductase [Agrobacterium sp. CNPSo 2736]|uniref:SDR family NAD(P)-dependent oxidoreductase n=1 Tax=Agrobacterium sp. CNPSo 2736 TaxID=2499627 RepID=UPI000FDAB1D7|nr:SDR family NAD(P)-dependent oxidoreductase [Agrobacterium sp. CNPSo 2736]RVT73024.1 SDR family oxidoreductase [Agrobacterium sp. CNPSo 2736]